LCKNQPDHVILPLIKEMVFNYQKRETAMDDTGARRYKELWDGLADNVSSAYYFVDGSQSEDEIRLRGSELAESLIKALDIQTKDKVLEFGCGVARIGRELSPKCQEWYGCDISSKMIEIATSRTSHLPNIYLQHIESTSLNCYSDDSFEKVYTIGVFIHMYKEDIYRILCEIYRVLKPGGVFSCGMWNILRPGAWRLWEKHLREDSPIIIHTWTSPGELQTFVTKAGFKIIAVIDQSEYTIQLILSKGITEANCVPDALMGDHTLFVGGALE